MNLIAQAAEKFRSGDFNWNQGSLAAEPYRAPFDLTWETVRSVEVTSPNATHFCGIGAVCRLIDGAKNAYDIPAIIREALDDAACEAGVTESSLGCGIGDLFFEFNDYHAETVNDVLPVLDRAATLLDERSST